MLGEILAWKEDSKCRLVYRPGQEDQFSQHSFCTCTYLLSISTYSKQHNRLYATTRVDTIICIIVHYLCTYSVEHTSSTRRLFLERRKELKYPSCESKPKPIRWTVIDSNKGLTTRRAYRKSTVTAVSPNSAEFKLYIINLSFFITLILSPLIKTRSFRV